MDMTTLPSFTDQDSSNDWTAQKPTTRPRLDVSKSSKNLIDWEKAQDSITSLDRLLYAQADKSEDLLLETNTKHPAMKQHYSKFSGEVRKLTSLREEHWEPQMHMRHAVLLMEDERQALHDLLAVFTDASVRVGIMDFARSSAESIG
ncbi:MAG: hypothetical protein Q9168_006113 [Polycauliona sp. 1 TL-2023]